MIHEHQLGLAVAFDAGAIAHAIRRILEDPALSARCGERGRAFAARYDWASVFAQEFEAIERLRHPRSIPARRYNSRIVA